MKPFDGVLSAVEFNVRFIAIEIEVAPDDDVWRCRLDAEGQPYRGLYERRLELIGLLGKPAHVDGDPYRVTVDGERLW